MKKLNQMTNLLLVGSLLFGLSCLPIHASETHKKMDEYLQHCEEVKVCNGVFLIADKGEIIHHRAYGIVGTKDDTTLTTHHAFDIGSVTKQFTAAAIMRLRDQGKLSFDDPLKKYIPEIDYPGITLRHLLNHTSGIPEVMKYFTQLYRQDKVDYPITNQRLISVLATQHPTEYFKPGTDWKYSNTGYYLLASVIERVSGLAYSQFMEQEFFEPLNMKGTRVYGASTSADFNAQRSYGFRARFDGARRRFDQIPHYFLVGSGGIYSTATDLFTWSKAIMAQQLFSEDSWTQATRHTMYGDNKVKEYGFGWGLKPSKDGKTAIKHSGDWRGFKAGFALYPDQGQTIVMLTNNNSHDGIDEVLDGLNAILADKTVAPVKQSLSHALYPVLMDADETLAASIFAKASDQSNTQYVIDERMLNQLGYLLLEKDKAKAAIKVFKFNNSTFPESPNTYDSLAEAHATLGDVDNAVELLRIMQIKFPAHTDYDKRQSELEALNSI
ncbi:hypothetical protein DRW07_04475 [Alteromonas sediminis]|uniref:Beta-lactamase-related domain-containing protein n=1 Tax=Alteromonas sediminis TaxID=2259342 RepID=A0A3N5Y3L9_9ALTE|nr:serine hydrolase domain-containing protein [Alteromonas sediminis]RPJ68657.1 hypothetical protein DRW07_04475 [Alteromonas sediminis]